jgi:hypothetical protein
LSYRWSTFWGLGQEALVRGLKWDPQQDQICRRVFTCLLASLLQRGSCLQISLLWSNRQPVREFLSSLYALVRVIFEGLRVLRPC